MNEMRFPVTMTRANWRKHPHAPWAFGHPADFLPTVVVPAARQVRPVTVTTSLPLGPEGEALCRDTHVDGLVVAKRGQILLELHTDHFAAGQIHLAFSISKAVTGLLAELLIAEALLDEHGRAGDLVPEIKDTAFANASLRDLLDMRDGVPFDEDYANPAADIHVYSRHFWGEGEGGVMAGLTGLRARDLRSERPFSYRTPVTDVIGLMLTRATGQSLDRLTRPLWEMVGAEEHARWVLDTGGQPIASAGFACGLRDLVRLGMLVGEAARTGATGPLPTAARRIMAGGDREAFARSGQPTRPGYSYRSGWWVDHAGGSLNALGVFGQRLQIVPKENVVIARFGSAPEASNQPSDASHAAWFGAIRKAIADG